MGYENPVVNTLYRAIVMIVIVGTIPSERQPDKVILAGSSSARLDERTGVEIFVIK